MGYKIIPTSVFPGLTEVRLYDETVEHVKANHPEVPLHLVAIHTAVERAIADPNRVERSRGGSYVFVDVRTTNSSGARLRGPVKGVDRTSGRVRTFYFASARNDSDVVYRKQSENG